ncbi:hypothetical protein TNCV_212111 [Trichonephila clavipes]|uniref:Uncharacterized protein n=1 Tax=Trichonephila clavipes TaxID=2585209 RepID=A0A8X6SV46_TRICX|nr:hypothetical protein TNCV_212111 [Trichonephila clavipes]
MSRFGGLSEERPSVFKTRSKLGTHLSTQCSGDERQSRPCAVLDESRSFFRVHTSYFSNIPKCIKAEFIASWACSQSSVVSSSKR